MPETFIHIALPDGRKETIYSPSSIVRQYFKPATSLGREEFMQVCEQALDHASQRVAETYGFACSSAMAEKGRVRRLVESLPTADTSQTIQILAINS